MKYGVPRIPHGLRLDNIHFCSTQCVYSISSLRHGDRKHAAHWIKIHGTSYIGKKHMVHAKMCIDLIISNYLLVYNNNIK